MELKRALLTLTLVPFASCYRQAPCERAPGVKHAYSAPVSQSWSNGAPGQRINTLATSPGPGWMWLEGCWYWNDEDWVWLSQQWMPPGGSMSYVGPEDGSRDDYCVYTPDSAVPFPAVVAWPPDVNYGRTTQVVVVHGEYGTRRPQGWHDQNLPVETVRDHRTPPRVRDHRGPVRRNEVVPARRGTPPHQPTPVRDPRTDAPVVDLVRTPPRLDPPKPPSGPRVERSPAAPASGPVSQPRPPVIHHPTRPTGPRTASPAPGRAAPPSVAGPSAPPRGTRPTPPRSSPPKVSSPRPSAPPAGRAAPPSGPAPRPASPPSRGSRPSPRASAPANQPSRRQR